MARKHKRRTRKRNKKGGFAGILGPKMSEKVTEGVENWKAIGKKGQQGVVDGLRGAQTSFEDVADGYNRRVGTGGVLPKPPQPPSSYLESQPQIPDTGIVREIPMPPSIEDTKEKKGGLLGLGWFGLGGRRLSHSSFINKMLRVTSKSKRNKAIRKYLKGGKKKTRKRKTKRRGGMNPQGGDNNLPRPQPEQRQQTEWERLEAVRAQHHRMQERRIAAARKERNDALRKEGSSGRGLGGGKRKRKNKTKKRRRRR